MLSVTSKISLDLGAIPLIWVMPLALYLLSFVLTFSSRRLLGARSFKIIVALTLLQLFLIFAGFTGPEMGWSKVAILIAGFFVIALYAHQQLYKARPSATYLTGFYLTMSVGGALGGLFNSIIGPVLFSGFQEAAVTVALAALIFVNLKRPAPAILRALCIGGVTGGDCCTPRVDGHLGPRL